MQQIPRNYEQKYADFLRVCEEARVKGPEFIIVSKPELLGENYEELIESLSRLADADLGLWIVRR